MRIAMLVLAGLIGLSGMSWAEVTVPAAPRTITVALDGSGDFTSIQEAVDSAKKGDTVFLKPGAYAQDLTIHSKDKIKLVGAGVDQVTMLGRDDLVGVLHVGKWPYGATDIEISGLTINEHGGHALGIFNGKGITLRNLRVKGMLFGQQVQDVRIEDCVIGGSETTGVQFSDSQALLVGNVIHDNDHGVNIAGKSDVRLERNVILRSLFEAVVVNDKAPKDRDIAMVFQSYALYPHMTVAENIGYGLKIRKVPAGDIRRTPHPAQPHPAQVATTTTSTGRYLSIPLTTL